MRFILCIVLSAFMLVGSCSTMNTESRLSRDGKEIDIVSNGLQQTDIRIVPDEDPVSVVTSYWQLSLDGDFTEMERLAIRSPLSFDDFDKRCNAGEENNDKKTVKPAEPTENEVKDSDESTAISTLGSTDWQRKSLMHLAEEVEKRRISPVSTQLVSKSRDEAIVSVSYVDSSLPGRALIFEYFFLFRSNEKWRIFMTVRDPLFHNPNYAGQNCS